MHRSRRIVAAALAGLVLLCAGAARAGAEPVEARIRVANDCGAPIELLWLDPEGKPHAAAVLAIDERRVLDSVIGRVWLVRRAQAPRTELQRFTVSKAVQQVRVARPGADGADSTPADTPDEPGAQDRTPTLTVVNALAEPISVNEPVTGGKHRIHAIVQPGQRWTGKTAIGRTWVVVMLTTSEVLRTIVIGERAQVETIGAAGEPAPAQPAGPASKTITISAPIEAIGIWAHVGGDTEMDTDSRDRVPVEVRSRLFHEEDGVRMYLYFSCKEYRGDGTAYAGPRRTIEVATRANGRIESGWRVTGIEPVGGPSAVFAAVSIGRQHGFQYMDTRGTFWSSLAYRVDARGRADGNVVGVRGVISVKVTLER